jgi:hypothetical protein
MKKLVIVFMLLSGVAYAVWHFVRPPAAAEDALVTRTVSTATSPTSVDGRSATTPVAPAHTPAKPAIASNVMRTPTVVSLKSPLAIEFEKSKSLKTFYDRYAANPEAASPELKYFAATAIEFCEVRGSRSIDADRAKFNARLKDNDPTNAQRIAAFERVRQLCEGFWSLDLSSADAIKLFREAAAAGNPGARVAVAAEDYREQTRNARGIEERRLSEEHLALLRESLATGDPFAIQRAGFLLNWMSSQLAGRRIGPNNDPFSPRDYAPAWTLAACDRGAICGADSYRVLNGCAQQGACGYASLETYMQYNELPPNVYANAQQYRSMILDAIEQGRWDWLGIQQGAGRTVRVPTSEARAPKPPTPSAPTAPRKIG